MKIKDNVRVEGSIPLNKGTIYFDTLGQHYYVITSKIATSTTSIYNLFNLNTSTIYLTDYVEKKKIIEFLKDDRYVLVREASITIEGIR